MISGSIPVESVLALAKEKKVSLTEYLASVMIMAAEGIQRRSHKAQYRLKPVKILIPINLRRFYPTNTMRNFSIYVTPGIDPKYGKYSFEEVLTAVHHYMRSEITEKLLGARISSNVRSEKNTALRITPLFIKNIALRLTFKLVGDRKSTTTISNLGVVSLPPQMAQYVKRMDFVLGPPAYNKVACAVLTYNGQLIVNFTRTIKECALEREFFRYLVKLGVPVKIESNSRW